MVKYRYVDISFFWLGSLVHVREFDSIREVISVDGEIRIYVYQEG